MQTETFDQAAYRRQFTRDKKFRVVREGCRISGMKTIAPWTRQGFRLDLKPGDILTCDGESQSRGDGASVVKWRDHKGDWICEDALFYPYAGGMWGGHLPEPGCLEEVEE